MTPLFACGALLLVAAVTPGPNNLVVMHTAAGAGFLRALPALGGIVLGSLALLAVVVAGLGAAFREWPLLRALIAAGGAAYLAWLGLSLMRPAESVGSDTALPSGALGLFAFQFMNPKGWLMMLTVAAAAPADSALATYARLAPLVALIPAACLLLWAGLGHALAQPLRRPRVRIWTDRVLGALLVASALPLLF